MVAQRYNINVDSFATDGINQTMLVSYTTRPFSAFSPQRFRLTNPIKRMFHNICQQRRDAFHNTHIPCLFPIFQIFICLWKNYYFHKSSNFTIRPLPFLMSSSPCLRISTIAGDDIMYSVSSIITFFAARRFRDFTAFFIKPSSSDITLSAPKSSEFNCNCAVDTLHCVLYLSFCKGKE